MKSTVLKNRKQSVCLLFCCLVAVIFLTGCMDAMDMLLFTTGTGLKPLPDVDYVGMTKREVYDKLVELDDPYISIRGTPQEGEEVYLHSAGSYFHSWEDLVSDSLFYDRKQWRVNNRGGSGWFSREYILTFEDERVISQETRRLPFK